MNPAGVPPVTDWEEKLSAAIASAYGRSSGTVWGPAEAILAPGVKLARSEVGLISVTDDGVINNRPLSAGLITRPRKLLLVVVDPAVSLDRQERAIVDLMPKTRHLTTVGLATRVQGPSGQLWRVLRIIEIDGLGIADRVRGVFPAVTKIRREALVPFGNAPADLGSSHTGDPAAADASVEESAAWFFPVDEPSATSLGVDRSEAAEVRVGDAVVLGVVEWSVRRALRVGFVHGILAEGDDRLRVLVGRVSAVAEGDQVLPEVAQVDTPKPSGRGEAVSSNSDEADEAAAVLLAEPS